MAKIYTEEEKRALAYEVRRLKESGLTGNEVAKMLGIPAGTASSLLSTFFKPVTKYQEKEEVKEEAISQSWKSEESNFKLINKRLENLEQGFEKTTKRDQKLQTFFDCLSDVVRKITAEEKA